MLKLRLPKLVALGAFALGVFSTAYADITPLRTGPVSQYGQLMAGKNAQNEGRIYGSCAAYSTSGNEVQVKGMSLFWSNEQPQNRYWRNDVITGEVDKQGIQIIRAAMAVDLQKFGTGHYFMNGMTEYYQDLLDEAVQAAIENDIYVIIDYHSHIAAENVNRAKEFFKIQAKKWGAYDNVIFEIFNEPLCNPGHGAWADISGNMCNEYGGMITWSEIKAYAEEVIPVIRRYSDNLIVVGTPQWSARPGDVVGDAIDDPNVAYTLHFYAGYTDDGNTSGYNTSNADYAMSKGLSVFVTEWGTIGYDGAGTIGDPVNHSDAQNVSWQTWMNANQLSSANWNLGYNDTPNGETAAEYFTVNFDVDDPATATWTYSASGQWVNSNVFNGLSAMTYSQCTSYVDLPDIITGGDGSDGEFGDVYEGYMVNDFDGRKKYNTDYEYTFANPTDGEYTWTIGNNGESIFYVDGSNVGGVIDVVTEGSGWAGYGVHVSDLKGCDVLSYRYRGLAHTLSFTQGSFSENVESSDEWAKMTFDLTGIDPSVLESELGIQWQVTGPSNGDSLLIDDVQCGEPFMPVDTSGSTPVQYRTFLVDDFGGHGAKEYEFVFANDDWTIGIDSITQPWGPDIVKTTYESGKGNVGIMYDVVAGNNGDAGYGVKITGLEQCAILQYDFKGLSHVVIAGPFSEFVSGSDTWTRLQFDLRSAGITASDDEIIWLITGEPNGGEIRLDDVRCISPDDIVVPVAYLIDNFDDGKGTSGGAFAYTYDGGGTAVATIAGNAYEIEDSVVYYQVVLPAAAYEGENGMGILGVTANDGDSSYAGAGLGVNLPGGLSGCATLSYQYKGPAHTVRLMMPAVTNGDNHFYEVPSSEGEWATALIDAPYLEQEWSTGDYLVALDLSQVNQIHWELKNVDNVDLLIDNVQCVADENPIDTIAPIQGESYLVDDFSGGGRAGDYLNGGYDYVYVNDSWTIGNPLVHPGWSQDTSYKELQKTVNDPEQGTVGAVLDIVSNGEGSAGIGSHVHDLLNCATVQYKYKGMAHVLQVYNLVPDTNDPAVSVTVNFVQNENSLGFAGKWMTATYDMNQAVAQGLDLSQPVNLQWEVQGAADGENFYVADVRCVGEDSVVTPVDYEEYLVADFENGGEKKSTGDYIYAWGKVGIGNTSCGADCYNYVLTDAANSGTYGAALVGITSDTTQVYGEATLDVMVPNLEGCYTLKYSYKGAAHSLLVRMNEDDDDLWNVNDYPSKSDWKTVYVSIGGHYPLDEITDIRFIVYDQSNYDYLYIDEVECVLQDPPVELPEPKDPTTNTELVDDFEDGDYTPLWTETWGDWTYESVASTLDTIKLVRGNQSSYAIQHNFYLNGMDWDEDEKDSVDIGYDPNASVTMGFDNMNLTHCTEVRYDYKGAAHSFRIKFSWEINDLLNLGWNYHSFPVTNRSDSWQTVSIPMGSLRQPYCDEGWGKCVSLDTIMRRASGFDWRVEGPTGMHDSLAIDNIRCIGLAETQYYTVTFKSGEDTLLTKTMAENSNIRDPELNPIRNVTAQYEYWFTGDWSPELPWWGEPVTEDITYEAVFDSSLRYYEITFLWDDGSDYWSSWEEYGTSIADFAPEAPFKDSTDEYTYSFAGWNPDTTGVTVTGPATFSAVFIGNKKQYCITFVDDDIDETELKAETCYDYGTLVTDIDVPTVQDKSASEKFAGWTPGLATVTGNQTYKAVYTDLNIITWKDYDGSVLYQDYRDNGDMLDVYPDPYRPATAEWTYTFSHWTPTVVTQVSGDAIYTAVYDSTKNQYYVVFEDDEYNELPESGNYNYGTNVSSIAPTPTKVSTAEFTYTFTGWNPAFTDQTVVTRDLYYRATFASIPRSYTVTFTAGAGATVPAAKTAVYGSNIDSLASGFATMPATAAKTFDFVKWTYADGTDIGEFDELTQDTSLVAVFNEFDRSYMITFLNYNGDPVKAGTLYTYGADVVTPDDPTRDPAGVYTYEFSGWSPLVTQVTQEQVYTATYDSTAHYGAIAVSVIDGKKTATIEGTYKGADKVEITEELAVDTVVLDRTLSNGVFSTIVLPFEINVDDVDGADFYTITEFTKNGNTWKNATAQKVPVNGQLEANKPYLMQPKSDKLVFHGEVTLRTSDAPNSTFSEGAWEFRGAYNYIVFGDSTHLLGKAYGFSAGHTDGIQAGEFVKAGSGAWIPAMRAYLVYNDGGSAGKSATAGSLADLPETLDVILVDEKGSAIGGGTVNTVTGQFHMDHWYDLQGRKLKGKPTTKGTYYHKGKMVIVK